MLKIYIVDDEIMAINYLKNLISRLPCECEVVGSAINGKTALEEIDRMQPDVVFLDISMPVMDGIEMAGKLFEKNRQQRIVFLTSYRDFDYIRQGMEMGIDAYLLKNELTVASLENELGKIEKKIRLETRIDTLYEEYNLKEFLLGGKWENEFSKRETGQNHKLELIYVTVKKKFSIKQQSYTVQDIEIGDILRQQKQAGIECKSFIKMETQVWCGIYEIPDERKTEEEELIVRVILDYYSGKGIHIIAVKTPGTDEIMQLQDFYQEAKQIENTKLFFGDRDVVTLEEVCKKNIRNENLFRFEILLEEAIDNNNKENERQILKEYFLKISIEGDDINYIQNMRSLFKNYYRYFQQNRMEKSIPEEWMRENFESCAQAERWFRERSIDFHKIKIRNLFDGYSKAVMSAVQCVEQQYGNSNLSVRTIAEELNISEGHLRRTFKEEIHQTINEYITNYRIAKAKKMLKDDNCRVTEIYEKVGFVSSQYFSSVFKKTVGLSPTEYSGRHRVDK